MTPDLEARLREMAENYHRTVEGEYGCPGQTCPGVQRLVTFAREVAALAAHEQRERDAKLAEDFSYQGRWAVVSPQQSLAAAIRATAPDEEVPNDPRP